MILAYVVIAAVVIGYLRGGRLRRYEKRPLRWVALPLLAFLIEAMYDRLAQLFGVSTNSILPYAVSLQYALLLLFCAVNIRRRGMALVLGGTALNLLVISMNGFRMPVSESIRQMPQLAQLVERIDSGALAEYVICGRGAPLWFLGDVMQLPFLPNGLASVGDLLLGAGVFWLVTDIMMGDSWFRRPRHRKSQ
ncbi:DUF5317 domain-containing protein [Eubacteriales bacterium OttesenSCG-928-N13]|nr:DUF5317 domain-containing protein [Eubacteriales bacterium OttesenSCG-928-N13]